MEPAYPFFYAPSYVLDQFQTVAQANNIYIDVGYFLDNKTTMFDKPCNMVQQPIATSLEIAVGGKVISFKMEELLVPGEWIDPYWTGKCYLGILPNDGAKDPNAFYLGKKYFEKYYTYFDINGVQTESATALRIGTGIKKPNVQILQQQYNISSPGYAPNK